MTAKDLKALDPYSRKREMIQCTLRIPRMVKDRLNRDAGQEDMTLNSYITHILIQFLMKGKK